MHTERNYSRSSLCIKAIVALTPPSSLTVLKIASLISLASTTTYHLCCLNKYLMDYNIFIGH